MAHFDDNARTGLHALALGALLIGVPVLVVQLIDAWQTLPVTTDAHLLQIFRNGYLLPPDGPQFTLSGATRMERVGLAAAVAVLAGTLATLACAPLRRHLPHWAVGRWTAGIALLVLVWSALALPVEATRVEAGRIVRLSRTAILGELALPFTGTSHVLDTPQRSWEREEGPDGRSVLLVRVGAQRLPVASTRADHTAVEAALAFLNSGY
jgi:hypothetical protein